MKQTAVEWLVDELLSGKLLMPSLTKQALEMEKEHQLSDEEIKMAAKEYVLYNDQKRDWVIEGMKLYREHLKQSKKD